MHNTTISEERIGEIEAGKIEPLKPFED